jgi:hypothetical protein
VVRGWLELAATKVQRIIGKLRGWPHLRADTANWLWQIDRFLAERLLATVIGNYLPAHPSLTATLTWDV